MLIEIFSTNQVDQNTRNLLYRKFPESFVSNQQHEMWTLRKKKVIDRIITINPFESKRYYLRILLNHIREPISFEDLRAVNSVIASTYCEVAILHSLLNKNGSVESCLQEFSLYQIPNSLRCLFETIIVYYNPTNLKKTLKRFEGNMSNDFQSINTILIKILLDIEKKNSTYNVSKQ